MDPDTTERDLIARAVAGDDRALEELFLSYYDRLARRIERRLPASLRRTVSEEDILQQTFFAACQELPGFEYRGRWSVYRWLCRIAEFRLRDTAKAQQTAKRGGDRVLPDVWVDSSEQLIDLLAAPRRTPSQSVARHEAVDAVGNRLATLDADYRQAIELRYVHGLPVEQVAAQMNRTPHAVHNLCYRGLRALEAAMGPPSRYLTRH